MSRRAAGAACAAVVAGALALPAAAPAAATDCGSLRHAEVLMAERTTCKVARKVARGWHQAQRDAVRAIVLVRGFRCEERTDAGEMARIECRRIAQRVVWYPVG